MSAWILVPCLVALRGEFNAIAPKRDKGSDGSIGDTAHAAGGSSDHLPDEDFPALRDKDADHVNEVHAIDIDSTGPWPAGVTMDKIVQFILGRCRKNNSDPANEPRLRYIIWNHKIYEAPNWTGSTYTGTSDPHTGHGHFSAEYDTSLEADTSPWGVQAEFGDDMSVAEVTTALTSFFDDAVNADGTPTSRIGRDAFDQGIPDPFSPGNRAKAYQVLQKTGDGVRSLQTAVTALAAVVAGLPQEVLDTLADAGQSDEDVAAALRAALGDRAAAVGALLASS